MIVVYIIYGALGSFLLGVSAGARVGQKECATAAIKDDPPTWWKRELIDARARREKAEVK